MRVISSPEFNMQLCKNTALKIQRLKNTIGIAADHELT